MAEGKPPYHNIHPMRVRAARRLVARAAQARARHPQAIFMIPTKPSPTLKDQAKYSKVPRAARVRPGRRRR